MAGMNRPTEFWLEQIVFWGKRLSGHCDGLTLSEFSDSPRTIDAASWCIGCIGEACGTILRIDPRFAEQNTQLELASAYAARNRFVHGYFSLDVEQMWSTATTSAPRLVSEVEAILQAQE